MTEPTYEQLKNFCHAHVALWNSGNREAYLGNFRQFLRDDEHITMCDPVGTKPRRGLKAAVADPFDLWQPVTRLYAPDETLRICGNETCWVMQNHLDLAARMCFRSASRTTNFEMGRSISTAGGRCPTQIRTSHEPSVKSWPSTYPMVLVADRPHLGPACVCSYVAIRVAIHTLTGYGKGGLAISRNRLSPATSSVGLTGFEPATT
jgi:hypothetical protein